ncbi:MAG TPA: hypothetical protein VH643_32115 [Gemmataceae bacterium]
MDLILGYTLFTVGALVSALNFYLSVLRYPLFRVFGWEYRWISGVPLIGSLLLAAASLLFWGLPLWFWVCLGMAVVDTGGPHWFVGSILWHAMRHSNSS